MLRRVAHTEEGDGGSRRRGQGGVVLRLELDPGDPLMGSIAVDGRPEKRFRGWIELMAAVNTERAAGEARSPRD
jgi:hypothetical protein